MNVIDSLQLGSLLLNSTSWADDLILLSLSRPGLQNCLLKLEQYCKKWGLEINEMKTKCMVMSKRRGPFEPVYIYNTPIEYVKSMLYLGFHISSNGSIRATIQDRIAKASRVSHMLLQALRTNRNVSGKLAMKLFDKQIIPILLYGSSVWGVPQTHNLCYLECQPENYNTRSIVSNMLQSILGRNVPFEYARRVGRRPTNNLTERKILIKLKFYSDKLELFHKSNGGDFTISNFEDSENLYEKVHHDFCKKALNISKYASNIAVKSELGRYPVSHVANSLAIKYWLRLNAGTANTLLNEAYYVCHQNKYDFEQGIQHMLCKNGFGDVYSNPSSVNYNVFHKTFRQRLNDQFLQDWNTKLYNSNRFKTLQVIHSEYKIQNYIEKIKNPEIREIYTRLRIDLNCLSTSKSQGDQQRDLCQFCHSEPEDVAHFLFKCNYYQDVRTDFYNRIDSNFDQRTISEKMHYVLNVDTSAELLGACCKFIHNIYTKRFEDRSIVVGGH